MVENYPKIWYTVTQYRPWEIPKPASREERDAMKKKIPGSKTIVIEIISTKAKLSPCTKTAGRSPSI